MTVLDYVFLTIALIAILIMVIHHFFIKPRSIERQHELDQLYKREMDKIVESIKGTNSKGAN